MVCVYCRQETQVTNSRFQSKLHRTWRRRQCATCHSVFTTYEGVDLASSFAVQDKTRRLLLFSRDELFVSIYKSCAHRPTAIEDAAALVNTVITQVSKQITKPRAILPITLIRDVTLTTLQRFDQSAATHYAAYHPSD